MYVACLEPLLGLDLKASCRTNSRRCPRNSLLLEVRPWPTGSKLPNYGVYRVSVLGILMLVWVRSGSCHTCWVCVRAWGLGGVGCRVYALRGWVVVPRWAHGFYGHEAGITEQAVREHLGLHDVVFHIDTYMCTRSNVFLYTGCVRFVKPHLQFQAKVIEFEPLWCMRTWRQL